MNSVNSVLSSEWETMSDISRRTGLRGELVIENVRAEMQNNRASLRFIEDQGVQITQIKRKDAENGK